MVLQDKYKAKASKAWKASRGLSTAPKPTTRRPQPPELDNQTEFPDLNKSDSSDGSSSENDSSGVSQSEDKLAFSSGSNNIARRPTNPKYSRRNLVDNSSKYDEPAAEQEEVYLSEEERNLSAITMKLAKVDVDFAQYVKPATNADDDDIDYDLANRHKKKEPQLLPIDSESSKAMEEMRNDRMKAEASWNLKSRLRGDSGRQYIQRYESSRRDLGHLENNNFFESVGESKNSSPPTTVHGFKSETITNERDNQPMNISTIDTKSDQNFLDELI